MIEPNLQIVKERFERNSDNPFYDRIRGTVPTKRYLLAMTPRSGSTFLAHEWSMLRILGFPQEFVSENYLPRLTALLPMPSFRDYEDYILHTFTSEQGVFGVEADWYRFSRANELECFPKLLSHFDCVVYLRRRDFVKQAISLSIALGSGTWHEIDAIFQDGSQYNGIKYDQEFIANNLLSIMTQEYYWGQYFSTLSCSVISVYFEDIIKDPHLPAAELAAELGLLSELPSLVLTTPRLSASTYPIGADWKDRFLEECGAFVDYWTAIRGQEPGFLPSL